MEHKQYQTPSGTVHYWMDRAVGQQATWLVLLPGLTADHTTFEPQFSFFSGRANLLSWDAPAHGLSRPFALDFSIDDMACMLHGILEAEGVSSPVFAGQSLGGYIAQAYIDLFPGLAGGFISIDSAPLKRVYYPNWEVALLRHTLGIYLCVPWALLKPWGAHGAARSEEGRAQMRRFIESYHKREYCELIAHCYTKLADAIDERRPYEIDCPALLLCGEKDNLGDVRPFNRKWTKGEGIPLVWVPGAGHISNADNPDFVNEQIEGFMGLA